MTHTDIGGLSVADWKSFFRTRANTREISGHGGGNRVSSQLARIVAHSNCTRLYGNAVQAVLDLWEELDAVQRDPYEVNPIHSVALAAFGGKGTVKPFFIIDLRAQYNRLWLESPRPFTDTHRTIALNSQGQIPVEQQDIELLFEQDGWGLVATRVASEKGWTNIAISLMEKLYKRETELATFMIVELVEMGFPKLKGLRWIYLSQNTGEYTTRITERWQKELLAEGMSEEEVFLQGA